MSEKKSDHHPFLPSDEAPIEVPSVEEAWSLMQKKLDTSMPVRRWYTRFKFWSMMTGVSVFVTIIWFAKIHSSNHDTTKISMPVVNNQTETKKDFSVPKKQETAGKKFDNGIVTRPADDTQKNITEKNKDSGENEVDKNSTNDRALSEKKSSSINIPEKPSNEITGIASKKGSTVIKKNHPNKYEVATGEMDREIHRPGDNSIADFSGDMKNNSSHKIHSLERSELHAPLEESVTLLSDSYMRFADSSLRVINSSHKKIKDLSSHNSADKSIAKEKDKSQRTKKSELLMSAGLSVKKNFPLSGQQTVSYNVNAGSNLLSDFIPAPYFRYFINDKIYLELALQINSPQYTRMQLIDSSSDSSRLIGWQQDLEINRVTLQKLYYTEIPLSFHYRLFNNFYIGAGIQYSRVWNGIADQTITMRPTNGIGADTLYSSGIIKLKSNPDAYAKINKTDWRILIEADYRWKKFTFGLRYQQALNTYLPVQPDGSAGKDKNSSIGLKVQYDLWRRAR